MMDDYQVPTLILLWLLVAVFAVLNVQRRNWRRRLWLAGWLLIATQMLLEVLGPAGGWSKAAYRSCGALGMLMFLGSMAVPFFGKRQRISWVAMFAMPSLLYVVLTSVAGGAGPFLRGVEFAAVVATAAVSVAWSRRPVHMPRWGTMSWASAVSVVCLCYAALNQPSMVIHAAQAGIGIWTAVLVVAIYRRPSPGVIFTAAGFVIWQVVPLLEGIMPLSPGVWLPVHRFSNLVCVVTAIGTIALVLEEETRENSAGQRRDRRARLEMERYARLNFPAEPHQDFGMHYRAVVEAVVEASRFSLAAILLRQVPGRVRLAAVAGASPEQGRALERLAAGISEEQLISAWMEMRKQATQPVHGRSLELCPWIAPSDKVHFTDNEPLRTVVISTREGDLQGVLAVGTRKEQDDPLMPEDLMALQLLAARLASARESAALQRRVTQSERLAGIGRLAGGIAHELNNPLTVVMGYAELLEETSTEEKTRRYAGVIRSESQRMRQVIDGLARFWRPSPSPVAALDLEWVLRGLETELRPECEGQGVHFEVCAAADLPPASANPERLAQVLKQLVANASRAAAGEGGKPWVRMEAGQGEEHLRIVVSNSGPGFPEPERLFDPFFTLKPKNEGAGMALSLCYSMIRELGGDMSAYNLQPHGAAVIVELPVALPEPREKDASAGMIHGE
ncbi:sensor histidine kinase [Silvibacterium dinghuense]|uniref:histidine kinase n=1 Tax=Silvibacterium dinghuense TaxID=1560006 RepID=A0A4Q1S9I6_9BACT|nr:ATP-binding protein [Silvibacterium dinghuense]RXS93698.1 hypothetical protein ESZ00_16720 [Silvibacterium dinghuense]GGH06905.1 hypothetical protein GCM10011586_23900 [Silvibacterium dinghuense]